jgi:hypothetical protein
VDHTGGAHIETELVNDTAVDRVPFGQEIGLLAAQKDNPRANIVHVGFDLFAFHSFAERVKARRRILLSRSVHHSVLHRQ